MPKPRLARYVMKARPTSSNEANALIIEVNRAKLAVGGDDHWSYAFHRLTPRFAVDAVAAHFLSHGYRVSVGAGPTLTLSRPSPFDQKAG